MPKDPLREPILAHQPHPVRQEVKAALDAEIDYLCKSGELDQLYKVWPDFEGRSREIHKLLLHRIGPRFPGQEVTPVIAAHWDSCSFVLQVNKVKGKYEAPADRVLSMSARRNFLAQLEPTEKLAPIVPQPKAREELLLNSRVPAKAQPAKTTLVNRDAPKAIPSPQPVKPSPIATGTSTAKSNTGGLRVDLLKKPAPKFNKPKT